MSPSPPLSKAVSRIELRAGRAADQPHVAAADRGRTAARRSRRAHPRRGRSSRGRSIGASNDAARADAAGRTHLLRVLHVAPLLPEFLASYPEVSIDLHLSDAMVDLIGEGFDAAVRLAVLPDFSLVARRLCEMPRDLVGSPTYLDKHGRPRHRLHLAQHRCIIYSYSITAETWRFTKDGSIRDRCGPSGPLRVNNGEAMMPALIAGSGLGILPEFILREPRYLPPACWRDCCPWSVPLGSVYWLTLAAGPRPKRVEILGNFLVEKLAGHAKRGAKKQHPRAR